MPIRPGTWRATPPRVPLGELLLILPVEGDPILLVDQPWHVEEARRMSWIEDVRSYPTPGPPLACGGANRATLRDALRAAGLGRAGGSES